jgi:hypothetical protein
LLSQGIFYKSQSMILSKWFPALGVSVALGLIHGFSIKNLRFDPDYFYHVGISKTYPLWGRRPVFPQAVGIGWDQFFPEKEYLFHWVAAFFYRLAGERAVAWVGFFFAVLTIFLLHAALLRRKSPGEAGLGLCLLLVSSYFLDRFLMLRPHTLAILVVVGSVSALMQFWRWRAFGFGLLFSLSYHAFQVPLALVGCAWIVFSEKKTIFFYLAGLVVGILIHPCFPGPLVMGWQHLQIAWNGLKIAKIAHGQELYPWSTDYFLSQLGIFLALSLGIMMTRLEEKERLEEERLGFMKLLHLLFLGLLFRSPRSLEFYVPLSILSFAHFPLGTLSKKTFLFLGLVLAMQVPSVYAIRERFLPKSFDFMQDALEVARVFPPTQKMVYNCSWDIAPYLYYSRPDLKFLDLLDPSFLRLQSQVLYDYQAHILEGSVVDLASGIRRVFEAKYVFCHLPQVNQLLKRDPRVKILHVSQNEGGVEAFELPDFDEKGDLPEDPFIRSYEGRLIQGFSISEVKQMHPGGMGGDGQKHLETSYWDLKKQFQDKQGLRCLWLKPEFHDQHWGGTFLGWGGGPSVRIWMNGKPYFQSTAESTGMGLMTTLIVLEHPLRKTDEVVLLSCAPEGSPYWGIALSVWNQDRLDAFCKAQKSSWVLDRKDVHIWPRVGLAPRSCVAPVAPLWKIREGK